MLQKLLSIVTSALVLTTCSFAAVWAPDSLRPVAVSPDSITVDPVLDYPSLYKNLVYPEKARRASVEGPMEIKALVDTTGRIVEHYYVVSLGPLFEKNVNSALAMTTFTPARKKNGEAAAVWVIIPLKFKFTQPDTTSQLNYHEMVINGLTTLMDVDDDNEADYLYLRGKQFYQNGNYDEAIEDYKRYSQLVSTNKKEYYEQIFLKRVTDNLWKDSSSIDSLATRAWALSDVYLYKQAIELSTYILKKNSNHSGALYTLATAYTALKNYPRAIEIYKKLLTIYPDNPLFLNEIAWNFYHVNQFKDCIEYSQKALKINPQQVSGRYRIALSYLRLGNLNEALIEYKEAWKMDAAANSEDIGKGAIKDLKALIHDRKHVEESKQILREVFKLTEVQILTLW